MSPQVAWLTLQGCKTLSVRMDAQSASAMEIATFLEAHPKVEQVMYPGLESFPQHELSTRQASGYGAMLWFEVKGGLAAGKTLMDNIEVWTLAENLGSVESLVTHPVTMTHADVEPEERARVGIIDGLVRLSVGLEDSEDLTRATSSEQAQAQTRNSPLSTSTRKGHAVSSTRQIQTAPAMVPSVRTLHPARTSASLIRLRLIRFPPRRGVPAAPRGFPDARRGWRRRAPRRPRRRPVGGSSVRG